MGKRGSRPGVKRGSYKKHKPRRYPTRNKTTTLEGKKQYQRWSMRERLGVDPKRFGIRGPRPERILLDDILNADLRKLMPLSPLIPRIQPSRRRKK